MDPNLSNIDETTPSTLLRPEELSINSKKESFNLTRLVKNIFSSSSSASTKKRKWSLGVNFSSLLHLLGLKPADPLAPMKKKGKSLWEQSMKNEDPYSQFFWDVMGVDPLESNKEVKTLEAHRVKFSPTVGTIRGLKPILKKVEKGSDLTEKREIYVPKREDKKVTFKRQTTELTKKEVLKRVDLTKKDPTESDVGLRVKEKFDEFVTKWGMEAVKFLVDNGVTNLEKPLNELFDQLKKDVKIQYPELANIPDFEKMIVNMETAKKFFLIKKAPFVEGSNTFSYLKNFADKANSAFPSTRPYDPRDITKEPFMRERVFLRETFQTSPESAYAIVKPFIDDFKKGFKVDRAINYLGRSLYGSKKLSDKKLAELLALTLYYVDDQNIIKVSKNVNLFLKQYTEDHGNNLEKEFDKLVGLSDFDSGVKLILNNESQTDVSKFLESIDLNNVEMSVISKLPKLAEMHQLNENKEEIDNFLKYNKLDYIKLDTMHDKKGREIYPNLFNVCVTHGKFHIANQLLYKVIGPHLLEENYSIAEELVKPQEYKRSISAMEFLYTHYQNNGRVIRTGDFDRDARAAFLGLSAAEVKNVLTAVYPGYPMESVISYVNKMNKGQEFRFNSDDIKKEMLLTEKPLTRALAIDLLSNSELASANMKLRMIDENKPVLKSVIREFLNVGMKINSDRILPILNTFEEDEFTKNLKVLYSENPSIDDAIKAFLELVKSPKDFEVYGQRFFQVFDSGKEFAKIQGLLTEIRSRTGLEDVQPPIIVQRPIESHLTDPMKLHAYMKRHNQEIAHRFLQKGADIPALLDEFIFRALPDLGRIDRKSFEKAAVENLQSIYVNKNNRNATTQEKLEKTQEELRKVINQSKLEIVTPQVSYAAKSFKNVIERFDADVADSAKWLDGKYEGLEGDALYYVKSVCLRRYKRLSEIDQKALVQQLGLGGITSIKTEIMLREMFQRYDACGDNEKGSFLPYTDEEIKRDAPREVSYKPVDNSNEYKNNVDEFLIKPLCKILSDQVGGQGKTLKEKFKELNKKLSTLLPFLDDQKIDRMLVHTLKKNWNDALKIKLILEKIKTFDTFDYESLVKRYGAMVVADGISLIENVTLRDRIRGEVMGDRHLKELQEALKDLNI